MNDEQIAHIWDAIKELNARLDDAIDDKAKKEWVGLEDLARIIGMSKAGAHYRLYHTESVEPEKDFRVINGKLLIKPCSIAKLSRERV